MHTLLPVILLIAANSLFSNPTLVNLPANTWFEAPNSKIRPLCPTQSYVTIGGTCAAVVTAWCSAAYDPIHHKMICFGGGHGDYSGNEVYTFDVNTLAWARITEPSPPPYSIDPLTDGNPVSRHTYDGLTYLTHANRFFAFGGSQATSGTGTIAVTWTFDVDSAKWYNMEPTSGTKWGGSGAGIHLTSSYHEKTRKVYYQTKAGTWSYHFDTNTWAKVPGGTGAPGGDKTSTIDTKRDLMFTLGDGNWKVLDIMNGVDVTAAWVSAKPTWCDSLAPGLSYDQKSDKIIGWRGGNTMYVLDLDAKSWSTFATTGAPAQAKGAGGIYGRFRYIPEYNVFILVNHVDDNAAFYKYSAGEGAAAEAMGKKQTSINLSTHPNPFNPGTTLRYAFPSMEKRGLKIYDAAGKLVRDLSHQLRNNRHTGTIAWDGLERSGTKAASGVYVARLENGNTVREIKLILAR